MAQLEDERLLDTSNAEIEDSVHQEIIELDDLVLYECNDNLKPQQLVTPLPRKEVE
jgi:hypothetical protein